MLRPMTHVAHVLVAQRTLGAFGSRPTTVPQLRRAVKPFIWCRSRGVPLLHLKDSSSFVLLNLAALAVLIFSAATGAVWSSFGAYQTDPLSSSMCTGLSYQKLHDDGCLAVNVETSIEA